MILSAKEVVKDFSKLPAVGWLCAGDEDAALKLGLLGFR
jgi:hypothetical protein